MRRSTIASLAIPVLGLALLGAPCSTQGPFARHFAERALVIPMDNCYQRRDTNSTGGGQTTKCNVTRDDGVYRAYGLVYLLLKHNITVYWAINGDAQNPKTSVVGADFTVSAPSSGPVVKKLNWGSGVIEDYLVPGCSSDCEFPASTPMTYIGGPFVIDAADSATVLDLLHTHADFAPYRDAADRSVDIHEVQSAFDAPQVRPLSGPPPKVAILNIYGPRTSADVMIGYARAAGFDWSCTPTSGTCAGGISKRDSRCTQSGIQAQYDITVNDGPGLVYDILCDADFLPDYTDPANPDFTKAPLLQKDAGGAYVYKLLWAPHWETPRGTCPSGHPARPGGVCGTYPDDSADMGTNPRNLADWLQTIWTFVKAGNNLFAECHAIVTLESWYGQMNQSTPIKEFGRSITRFQSTNGMNRAKNEAIGISYLTSSYPTEPYMQIADFRFQVGIGNVSAYHPDPDGNTSFDSDLVGSSYRTDVKVLINENSGAHPLDVLTTYKSTQEGALAGAVIYLGGHDYSPAGINNTAGTRIVLNTLFNLGFACVEPDENNNSCNTGLQGECAAGTLKCSGGALTCVPNSSATTETCNNGNKDYNCDGVPGQNCSAGEACNNGVCVPTLCTDGQTQSCYEGAAGSGVGICQAGTQTCSGGVWGVCTGQVLPGPAVCNGKDNDCDGDVDTDCPTNRTCTNGVCLPNMCGLEDETCPTGFTCCLTVGGSCTSGNLGKCIQVDGCSATCTNGTICNGTSCIDPCASVTCPQGTICAAGVCQAGGCYFSGCSSGQVCSQGTCIADPCTGVSCPTGTFCRAGDCVRSCESIVCPSGQVCGTDGYCEADCTTTCGSGDICVSGTCQTDPCSGKSCGTGQVCSGGACVDDPCRGVTCQSGSCSKGQCPSPSNQCVTSVPKFGLSSETPVASAKGGCSTSGGGGLMSLLLVGLGILVLRRRQWALAQGVRLAGVAVLLVAAVGCKSGGGGGNTSCPTGQTNCGGTCVDLTSSTSNCGACGCACQSGYSCAQSACLLPTGNPYLSSISPSSTGSQGAITLQLTGTGFDSTAQMRIIGAGLDGTYSLTVSGTTSATATLDASTMGKSHVGTAQVRVVIEPTAGQRLSSNALPFVVKAMPYLLSRSPAFVQQDSATPTITLTGTGFVTGLTATLTPDGGTSQSITATYTDAQHCQVTLPTGLALGTYLVQVTNPDGSATNTMPVAVREGVPVITSPAAGDCRTHTPTTFSETVTGSYLYPTSVARVSGSGLNDAVLPTVCVGGTQNTATGQCQNGLTVTVDLTLIQNGSYNITIWNPGSPSPLKSSPALTYTIKDSCP